MGVLETLVVPLVLGTFRASIPLIMCAVAEILNEKAGLVNIGIEGVMLFGAFMAVYGSWLTGDPMVGLALAALVGLAWGVVFALVSIHLRGDQIVAGVGINMFAIGFTEMMIPLVWGTYGYSESVRRLPPLYVTPGGERVSWFLPASLALAVLAYLVMYRTRWGLYLRGCGENPIAIDAAGVSVYRVRYAASTVSSLIFALAGAYMGIDWNNAFVKEMTGGRGFISLALVIFSNWNPLMALVGGMIFGFFDILQFRIGGALGVGIPPQVPQMVPYVATVLVLLLVGRVRPPAAAGKPFVKE